MDKFRNIEYDYRTPNDSFIARGLQLNQIVDEINGMTIGNPVVLTNSGIDTVDISLGKIGDIDAVEIGYKATFDIPAGSSLDQSGTLNVNNSMDNLIPKLSWTRESVNHTQGSEEELEIEFVSLAGYLIMRVTNTTLYNLEFTYNTKILRYVASS